MSDLEKRQRLRGTALRLSIAVCLLMGGCKDASVGHHERGDDYFDNGEYDRAIVEFTKCLDKKPRVAEVHYSRGLAHYHEGAYDQAIVVTQLYAAAWYRRGLAYHDAGQYEKAWDDINKSESLGYRIDPGFLKRLRESPGRES